MSNFEELKDKVVRANYCLMLAVWLEGKNNEI